MSLYNKLQGRYKVRIRNIRSIKTLKKLVPISSFNICGVAIESK